MKTISTILPIFIIIAAGWLARKRSFIPESFIGPANQIVYYFAIPAMIFRAVSRASFHDEFSSRVMMITLACILVVFGIAWAVSVAGKIPRTLGGTFIQSSFHGNLGYIGLAVVFYSLGNAGLARGAILAGFIMIVQNVLAVAVLQIHSGGGERGTSHAVKANLKRILGHPVILSACGGMGFSLLEIPLPVIAERSLGILSGMALPLALLLIGATLSFDLMRLRFKPLLAASLIKLVVMPGLALLIFTAFSIPAAEFLPAFILLASPTATLTFVMAKEMGDPDFAVAAISGCTLMSGITFSVWLHFLL
jgi:predicted permease